MKYLMTSLKSVYTYNMEVAVLTPPISLWHQLPNAPIAFLSKRRDWHFHQDYNMSRVQVPQHRISTIDAPCKFIRRSQVEVSPYQYLAACARGRIQELSKQQAAATCHQVGHKEAMILLSNLLNLWDTTKD